MKDLWDLVTRSGIRRNTLIHLYSGESSRSDLKDFLGTSHTSTLTPELKKLEERGLIEEESSPSEGSYQRIYRLTPLGEILADRLIDLSDTVEAVASVEDFWKNHAIEGIPEPFRKRFHQLKGGRLVKGSPSDIDRPLKEYFDAIDNSGWVRGYSPIFREELLDFFTELTGTEKDQEIIFTEEIAEKLSEHFPEGLDQMEGPENVQIYTTPRTHRIAFTVTDSALLFGLFDDDGAYDMGAEYVNENDEAIEWGKDLFDHLREEAEELG